MKKIYNYFRHTLQGKIIMGFFTTQLFSNVLAFFIVSPLFLKEIAFRNKNYVPKSQEFHGLKIVTLIISFIICVTSLYFISRLIVKQIKKLTLATNEVAEGNFNIKLKTKEKDEIAQLICHFNKMTSRLKNTAYIQNDFINNVSHELKTPISSIQGFAKILRGNNLSEEERLEYIDIIIEESKRLEKLSSNILKISKLENQDTLKNLKKFSLDENIRRSILLLQDKWSKKNIDFNIDMIPTYYYGDEELFLQVWNNIIENAIKFSKEDGKIDITLEKNIDFIKVYIKDRGIGMSEEVKECIFDKFYQQDNSRHELGYGLGLSIAKRIVELSNGSILVESKINEGSTFIVTLLRN